MGWKGNRFQHNDEITPHTKKPGKLPGRLFATAPDIEMLKESADWACR
jgi:hypothetical protein